jgi:hypothetical protein
MDIFLFTLIFAGTGIIAGMASLWAIGPNITGIGTICIPLVCAFPLALIFFLTPAFVKKAKPTLRYLLPALVFPILFGILFGYTLYERRPENIYKVFVSDPIPAGVSNIQAYDKSGGFETEVIIACNTMPNIVDEIIIENELVLDNESFNKTDIPLKYFPSIDPKPDWQFYMKFDEEHMNWFFLWVNPEKTVALFRLIDG